MSEEDKNKDYHDDWNEIRDGLYHKVEEIMLEYSDGDILRIECPKCHHRTTHPIGKYNAIYRIVDLIIEQMNAYQIKASKQWIAMYQQPSDIAGGEERPLEKVLKELVGQRVLTPADCRKLM